MHLIRLLIFSFFLVISASLFADPPTPPSDPSSGGGNGPVGAPIDGGLGILMVMGVAYGGKKYHQSWKAKKKAEK